MDSSKKKKVSRRSKQLTDELSTSVSAPAVQVELALLASPIYAAKWRENMDHQPLDRLGNRELMQMSVMEAKELLELCK